MVCKADITEVVVESAATIFPAFILVVIQSQGVIA